MYDNPNKPLHVYTPLLDRIKNGDFDYSHYGYQAMWCEHEMNKLYMSIGYGDMGRYVEAFFRIEINWNTKNGAIIVSLNQAVPVNPFSIDSTAASITTQKPKVFSTLSAFLVWNPSLLIPAHTPKNPSAKTTNPTERN